MMGKWRSVTLSKTNYKKQEQSEIYLEFCDRDYFLHQLIEVVAENNDLNQEERISIIID